MHHTRKTSPVWQISKTDLQNLLNTSDSYVEVLKALGLSPYTGNQKTLKARIIKDNLCVKQLQKNRKKMQGAKLRMSNEDMFIENSKASRNNVKRRIIKQNLIPYKCRDCDNTGEWNGKKLSLQLEHINGIRNDNRLENLCFLCPNCHSQTDTYAGKKNKDPNRSKYKNICESCDSGCHGKKCKMCDNKNRKLKFDVTKEELKKLVSIMPFTKIGEKFGVSDNAIRKRCKKLGVDIPRRGRGYWSCNESY